MLALDAAAAYVDGSDSCDELLVLIRRDGSQIEQQPALPDTANNRWSAIAEGGGKLIDAAGRGNQCDALGRHLLRGERPTAEIGRVRHAIGCGH